MFTVCNGRSRRHFTKEKKFSDTVKREFLRRLRSSSRYTTFMFHLQGRNCKYLNSVSVSRGTCILIIIRLYVIFVILIKKHFLKKINDQFLILITGLIRNYYKGKCCQFLSRALPIRKLYFNRDILMLINVRIYYNRFLRKHCLCSILQGVLSSQRHNDKPWP